jgi:hypothetical protein
MLIKSRLRGVRAACFLLGISFFSQMITAQDANIGVVPVPESLRRPERGEAPRYPEDLVIGELGQGEAPQGAYLLAQEILSALARGRNDAPVLQRSSLITEEILEEVGSLGTRSYRIGGGRYEPDGSVSFLVRFIGRTESITGELFVRFETQSWLLDDLMLEEKVPLSNLRDSYRYDFTPYERFY